MGLINICNGAALNSFYTITKCVNDTSGGLLITGGIFAFYIIILMASKKYSNTFLEIWVATSWVMFLASGFLAFAQLLNILVVLAFLGFSIVGTIILYVT